jgi:CheY-like chemotaxis protein
MELEIVDGAYEAVSDLERKVIGLEQGQDAFRILVVEDNKLSRKLLVTLLTKVGFEVRDASDGQEAVNVWKEWQPHLIWMDLRMPVLDGYEATEKIRSLSKDFETLSDTRIIALTASAFEENKARAFASGCDDFVRKPFRESEIFTIMATQLGARYVYGDHAEASPLIPSTELLNNSDLAAQVSELPGEIVERLAMAADLCDADRVDQIIDEIKSRNLALAETLARFSSKFDYDRIMQLMKNR